VIYLDNAATSLPKPRSVERTMVWGLNHLPSPGRGSSSGADAAAEVLFSLRMEAGAQFHCQPEQVILTTSCTHGLNIAIKSLVNPGDRVVVSCMEHNAVMRPLHAIGAEIHVAGKHLFDSDELIEELDRLLTPDTRLCVMTHVSNVFGWRLPVEEAAALCKTRGIPFVLDAAQSVGCLDIDMQELGAAFIAMPGHKGLMGPQGTGLLLCGSETKTLIEGGTGSISRQMEMPEFLPDRLEPGTHNMPGAAGLLAGLRAVRSIGTQEILRRERELLTLAEKRLGAIPGIRLYQGENQTGVLSFVTEGTDCVLFGEELSHRWDIALRSGLHCAPLAHETAGTIDTGTIRVSFGPMNRRQDAEILAEAVELLSEEQKRGHSSN
jgi:selenocysteine lyase/cysteine desulfurase